MKAARALVLAALLAPLGAARADTPACTDGAFSFYLENDLFNRTDRNYTSGVKLAWVSRNLADFGGRKCMPDWMNWIEEKIRTSLALAFENGADERNFTATIGQEIYTPADRARTDLIRDDRPYAGWLYLGLGYNERRDTRKGGADRLDSFELRLGVVGPGSLARQSQNLIHDIRGFDRFLGWDHQLRNEPGVQVLREVKLKRRLGGEGRADVIGHFGGSLGNVATYLNAGAEVRFGSAVPDDFGSSPTRPAGNNTSPGALGAGIQAHAFASVDLRAVARDLFLDGNTFESGPRVHKRPFVGDLSLGLAGFAHGWKFSFARVFRTTEFDGQNGRHSYGSFTVSTVF